ALRDELETAGASREVQVQSALVAGHHEVAMLKATVTALREELETAFRERETAIQIATRNLANEHAQLCETVQMLRNQVDAQSSGTRSVLNKR
ncbi:MAG: hypothetical protein EBT08_21720, partial [Betaproteobacteria bacterium]|nr:hypothetical protein [Betaproteobacteria bacterium]